MNHHYQMNYYYAEIVAHCLASDGWRCVRRLVGGKTTRHYVDRVAMTVADKYGIKIMIDDDAA